VKTHMPAWRMWTWVLSQWNVMIVAWLVAGHLGVRAYTGEGRILQFLTIGVIWLVGDAVVGVVWMATGRRRRENGTRPRRQEPIDTLPENG
jgi:threonine/homoserine/homoserine lactone efflux protein